MQHALYPLYAESRVKFTNKVIDMQISAETLVTYIKNFQTYILHSLMSASVHHNELFYALLRSKMKTAKPNILLHGSTEHSSNLEPKFTFEQHGQQAMYIAYRVQTATSVTCEALPSEQ